MPKNSSASTQKKQKSAIQFYVELCDFKPKLWRRFVILSEAKMSTLAYAILSMFKATGEHLFKFEVPLEPTVPYERLGKSGNSETIEFPNPYDDDGVEKTDPRRITVGEVFKNPNEKCLFFYDYGDDWEFKLKAEKIEDVDYLGVRKPVVILDGKNYGIIDDCGGLGGLEDFIEAFKKKSGEEYENLKEWFGQDDFDFSEFDLDAANSSLKEDMKFHKTNYESMF